MAAVAADMADADMADADMSGTADAAADGAELRLTVALRMPGVVIEHTGTARIPLLAITVVPATAALSITGIRRPLTMPDRSLPITWRLAIR